MPAAAWNSRFYEADPRFWPIAPAAARFRDFSDFPAPGDLQAPGITFVAAVKPRRARRRREAAGYDARITLGEVPTRRASWHDFLNALVWATFPLSKRALHARQAAAIERSLADGTLRLPNARTREQDALALLDEGGVLEVADAHQSITLAFGHALYETLVCEGHGATASCLRFMVASLPDERLTTALADQLLAARLTEPLTPEALERRAF